MPSKKKRLPILEPIPAPDGKTKAFLKGWDARMANKPRSVAPESTIYKRVRVGGMLTWEFNNDTRVRSSRVRKQWITGYTSASREIGKQHRAIAHAAETKRMNEENDIFAELGEEFAA